MFALSFSFGQCKFVVIFAVTIATLTAGVTSSFSLDGAAADQTTLPRLVGPPFFFSLGVDADNETTYAQGASSVSQYLSGSSLSWASG